MSAEFMLRFEGVQTPYYLSTLLDAGLLEDAGLVSRHCTGHTAAPPDSASLICLPVQPHLQLLQNILRFLTVHHLDRLAAISH